jgi:hypothetical protein
MDSAARLRGPLATLPQLVTATRGVRAGGPLSIVRQDRPQENPATAPATRLTISPQARQLAAAETHSQARRPGRDEPATKPATPAANETSKTESRNHMPDQLGPRDAATRIQAFGGLNVRSSTGGPKLTSGD